MVATLFTLEYLQLADWSIAAPTKTLTNEIYAVGVAAQKQFEEAMSFSPGFNASHSAKAEAGYTALIEKSARTVKTFLASEASVLVGTAATSMTPATWTQSPLERRTAHRPSCAPTIPRR